MIWAAAFIVDWKENMPAITPDSKEGKKADG